VLEAARASGKPVSVIPVNADGVIDLVALDKLLAGGDGRTLVSVMLANNETGVIQPVRDVVAIAGSTARWCTATRFRHSARCP
jgi:cysteine desulfurase